MSQYRDGAISTLPSIDDIRASLVPILQRGHARKAIVFGSYARGEADEYSDLDLIIVANTARPFFERLKDFMGVFDVWRRGLDMLIYTPDELEEMLAERRPFIELAMEEGVVIYEG
ncbi:MAG: nucleotidyltransferase domain-containing protein [Chloroflexi bacterium]|nr:nucleotidyltransferase domain-containing protein [Chloroflexota bacterium]